jgi:hypothetical protein
MLGPPIQYEYVPKDPENKDGPTIRVGKLKPQVFSVEQPGAQRVYLTPYSKEKVDEFLKYAAGPLDNHVGPHKRRSNQSCWRNL